MTHTPDLVELWPQVLQHVQAHKDQFSPSVSAVIVQLQPITMVQNIAVFTAPSDWHKRILDAGPSALIAATLTGLVGEAVTLNIVVNSATANADTTPPPADPEPAAPTARPQLPFDDADPASTAAEPASTSGAAPTAASAAASGSGGPAGAAASAPTAGAEAAAEEAGGAPGQQDEEDDAGVVNAPASGDEDIDTNHRLNPAYTFDTFIVGASNRLAHASCQAVAEQSYVQGYNPLFIYGPSGLGKTHLLHAIGNYVKKIDPTRRIRYVTSEEMTNEFIDAIRQRTLTEFKQRYRRLDILIVDDIQFLANKESTQEEFFHTFNALYEANKQIVLSSDRPPHELQIIEDRLRTRFEAGLPADIKRPELETRQSILTSYAKADGRDVPRDVIQFIAERYRNSVRELQGALNRVTAFANLHHEELTVETAQKVLNNYTPDDATLDIGLELVADTVADFYNINVSDLTSNTRVRNVVKARQVAMFLIREFTDLSLLNIGEFFGGRDHTTVLHSQRKVKENLAEDQSLFEEIETLTDTIKQRARG